MRKSSGRVVLWLTSSLLLLSSSHVLDSTALTISSDPESVRFFAYDSSRSQLEDGRELQWTNNGLNGTFTNLRKDVQTKILIHGFRHNYACWFPQELKDAYISRGYGENIITVDLGPLVSPRRGAALLPALAYPKSVKNVGVAGRRLGEFLANLTEKENIPLSSIHIIGLSLGAHVAGTAGEYVKDQLFKRIGRITGLDPAGPMFQSPISGRGRALNKFDADFVDVIHTNLNEYGHSGELGHIDFFVNGGGPSQPGCENTSCAHHSAANYFLQSIRNETLVGCKCQSYSAFKNKSCPCDVKATFGDGAKPESPEGVYYMEMKLVPLSGKYKC